ncbi:hypothetical protein PSYMO_37941, partial [Pseudomonas amygdali pv. mori str. 301020]
KQKGLRETRGGSVIENAPEITACEAMMVAIVDRPI